MRERGDIMTSWGCCNKGFICGYGWLELEAAASMQGCHGNTISRVWSEGGGTLNPRIKCPGETLETRWGHFFLG